MRMFRDMSSSYEKLHRHEYSIVDTDTMNLALNVKRAETLAFIAYETACKAARADPLDFEAFLQRAIELDQKWLTEREVEQCRIDAEDRAAMLVTRRLAPKLMEEAIRKHTSILSSNGELIKDLDKLICPSCKAPYDWLKYATAVYGESRALTRDEKALRKAFESGIADPPGEEHGQLYCRNLIPSIVMGRDGRPVANGDMDVCMTQLAGKFWRFIKR